ncbi:glycine oxidase ThiO [Billgrantia aerodenitrificans]|uniref:Glycine oxidase ThiO n=1 Tax=Billgrantia aerodenitrificans TaxID=2733483 RepID=A0ABS9AP36_9GAMM|nr:glycine oxidase ThiO [Halomonas aerodenitrificans]MCE8023392.1 glycine oxidase ThiO [Halomonas aerodenitrificans]
MQDVLIIGGGVIGMMTAWQLAEAGQSVTLLERRQCGQEASWAGGGIVSPLYPWRYSEPVSSLARSAEREYPQLAARLLAETGIDPEYRKEGLLYLRVDDGDHAFEWARQVGKPLEAVGADFIYAKEPWLAEGFTSGLWMPTLGSIRNPRLCQALRARLMAMQEVTLEEGVEVERVVVEDGRVSGAVTSCGYRPAAQVVLCGGAWSGELLAQLGQSLPVRPVKGQMMVFRTSPMPAGRQLLERVVLADGRYLIPRGDGRVLVGSTLEEVGFDKTPTDEARESLRRSALAMVPALAECPIEQHWAGLRPAAPEGIPFIGELPEIQGLFVNAGHYRNGLVLAPAATRLMVDLLMGRPTEIDPAPFQPALRLAIDGEPVAVTA